MTKTRTAKARREGDPRRARVVAWVLAHPGCATGEVRRNMPQGWPPGRVWAYLMGAVSRGELRTTGSRSRQPGTEPLRFWPPG